MKKNPKFATACNLTLTICRELYNAALQERRDAWRINHISLNYHTQRAQLPDIKTIRKDVEALYSQVPQDVLRRLSQTFDAFFRRCQAGETPGYPRFKNASQYKSFTYPQTGFRLEGNKLFLSKIGSCRVYLSRPIEGTIKTCTIKHEIDGWYVLFSVEENQSPFFPKTGKTVGIDVGIENFATLSTGETIKNPTFYRIAEKKLKTAQRKVSRRPNKHSQRRRKAIALLARQHHKIARQRRDFHYKTAINIVRKFDEIAIEDLNIAGLVQNPHLAKSISDAGWYQFASILTSKAENAGRKIVKVNPHYTSQDCSNCGNRTNKTLATRQHQCLECGLNLHRDHNAAINIQKRGALASGMVPIVEPCEPKIRPQTPPGIQGQECQA